MAKTDKKTLELIQLVKTQRAEIAKAEKPSYKTNLSFPFIEGRMNDAINLHVETKIPTLIGIASFLLDRAKNYDEAAKALGVENPPEFTWNGFTLKDWLDDLKAKIAKIQIESKKRKLAALEERLNKVISPELRAEMELEAIEAELK